MTASLRERALVARQAMWRRKREEEARSRREHEARLQFERLRRRMLVASHLSKLLGVRVTHEDVVPAGGNEPPSLAYWQAYFTYEIEGLHFRVSWQLMNDLISVDQYYPGIHMPLHYYPVRELGDVLPDGSDLLQRRPQ